MRYYKDIPVLNWKEDYAVMKAWEQILHHEPLILQMPDNFDATVDGNDYGCKLQQGTDILYDCDGGNALPLLAIKNHLSELNIVAEACIISSSQVDIDSAHKRIIVHG